MPKPGMKGATDAFQRLLDQGFTQGDINRMRSDPSRYGPLFPAPAAPAARPPTARSAAPSRSRGGGAAPRRSAPSPNKPAPNARPARGPAPTLPTPNTPLPFAYDPAPNLPAPPPFPTTPGFDTGGGLGDQPFIRPSDATPAPDGAYAGAFRPSPPSMLAAPPTGVPNPALAQPPTMPGGLPPGLLDSLQRIMMFSGGA